MRSDKERLSDVLDAAEKIRQRVAHGRDHFEADEDVQFAVVHLIEIVGEAVTHVSSDLRASHPEIPWRAVAGMRNRVVHGYFDIDHSLVWNAAEHEVPALAAKVRAVLEGLA